MLLMSIDVDGSQMTRLGEKIGVSRQAVAKLVQNLEAGGYVQKSPDKSDKRASIVSLTDNGWKLIKNIVEIKSEIEQEYCSVIGEEQMQQLRSNLNRLLNTFE